MTNSRMFFAAAVAMLGISGAWAQELAPAMPEMDHSDVQGRTSVAEDRTSGATQMDHGKMGHGTTPDSGAHAGHDMGSMQGGSAPPDARDPHVYSGGYTLGSGAYALPGGRPLRLADEHNFGSLRVDRFERARTDDNSSTAFDVLAWYGRNYDRAWFKTDGEADAGRVEDARTELLWGHAVAAYWDTQLGVRHDGGAGPDRNWLAFGVQGLAPYWFEVDAAAYIGNGGRTALRVEAEYELLLTQKLILQPRIEGNVHGKSDAARERGTGLSNLDAGMRLRYEMRREFAPYVGIEWTRKFGGTADFARAAGEDTRDTRLVAGLRFWF